MTADKINAMAKLVFAIAELIKQSRFIIAALIFNL